MKKLFTLTLAVCAVTSVALAQETVTTQRTETQATSAGGATTRNTTTVSTTDYVDRMRTVYSSAGIAQTKTERLIQLDRQLFDAYREGDIVTVRRIRTEIRDILGDDVTKVHTYVQSNPLPGGYPDFVVNTYAPQSAFTRDISFTAPRVSGGTSVGVDANARQTGTAGGTVSGSTTRSGASTSGEVDANATGSSNNNTGTQTGTSNNTQGTNTGQGTTGSGTDAGTASPGSSGASSTPASGSTGGTGSGSPGSSGSGTGSTGSTGSGSGSAGSTGSGTDSSGSSNRN